MDFSDSERAELRRYFDALAGCGQRIRRDKLENMLISLGLAETRDEVAAIVDKINSDSSAELDFEEYLEIVRTRTDANIFQVFKAMMEGKLGDRNLNFQTVISTYRRQLILDATGARSASDAQQDFGKQILQNFAALQRSRHEEAVATADVAGPSSPVASGVGGNGGDAGTLPFEIGGRAPLGGLEVVWRGVCIQHGIVSSRPASADGRSRCTLGKPPSPRQVINSIVKVRNKKKIGGTVVVSAPALEEGAGPRRCSTDSHEEWSG